MKICANTLDDLLREVFEKFKTLDDDYIESSRGKNKEIRGVLLKLKCPRARISHSERRGHISSPLGEFFWYLSGLDDVDFIKHYVPKYWEEAESNGKIFGAYGPRLFGEYNSINQFQNILKLLKRKPFSRQAVIQLFDREDINNFKTPPKNIPCTCTLQFIIRNNKLEMFTHMRSNDAYIGLLHDIFAFTMIQEVIASQLNVSVGTYHHLINSLHLYERDEKKISDYLNEGFQTIEPMPKMPKRSCGILKKMLLTEESIRKGEELDISSLNLDDYWKDIARLLQIHSIQKDDNIDVNGRIGKIKGLENEMKSSIYNQYIRATLMKLEKRIFIN